MLAVGGGGRLGGSAGPPAASRCIAVLGNKPSAAVRAIVESLVREGRRVVILGRASYAPDVEGVKLVRLGRVFFSAAPEEGGEEAGVRAWAEKTAAALVVAEGLDTAEVGMVAGFLQRNPRPDPGSVDELVKEYGMTHASRLKDAVLMLATFFGGGQPGMRRLAEGSWRVLVISTSGLSPNMKLFAQLYLLHNASQLFHGCALVFDGAEYILPDLNTLPYDARGIWLRLYDQLSRLKAGTLILVSRNPLVSPQVLDLADCYVLLRGPASLGRHVEARTEARVRVEAIPDGAALIYAAVDGAQHLYWIQLRHVRRAPKPRLEAEAEMLEKALRSERMSAFRDTILYKDLADDAEAAFRILQVASLAKPPAVDRVLEEAGAGRRLLEALAERGYVTVDGGMVMVTQLGYTAITEWRSRVGEAGAGRPQQGRSPPSQQAPSPSIQSGLEAFSKPPLQDIPEVYKLRGDAATALLRGQYARAVKLAYKSVTSALRRLTGEEKGNVVQLFEKAREEGVAVLEEQEAKKALRYIAVAERAEKKIGSGEQLSDEELRELRHGAEMLLDLADRLVAYMEAVYREGE